MNSQPYLVMKPKSGTAHNVRIAYIYLGLAILYVAIFTPLYFMAQRYWLGFAHLVDTLIVLALLWHVHRTKTVELTANVLSAVAAMILVFIVLDGGVDASGVYYALPATILIFILSGRNRGLRFAAAAFVPLCIAWAFAAGHYLPLPYDGLNFLLFLFSFIISAALLYLYANEQEKLDMRLSVALSEIGVLVDSLKEEKATIEDQVKLRTRQYKEEHAKLAASIESLGMGFIILDEKLTLMSINQSGRKLLELGSGSMGLAADHPSGLTLQDIQDQFGKRFDLVRNIKTCLRTRKAINAHDITLGKHFLSATITPIIDERELIGAVILIEDMTDIRALERSRDEFFSIASHELRTPLTAIMGNASMALQYYDRLGEAGLKEVLQDINVSGKRLIAIVNDFLDSSRLELGKFKFKLEPTDAINLARESVEEALRQNPLVHTKLSVTGPSAIVLADGDRLKQVLRNLLDNALKYTPRGRVVIDLSMTKTQVRLAVTDTGSGIPLAAQHLLFRKFQQTNDNILTRDSTQSTGLGLYISRLLMKGMKGKLELHYSEPGKGSIFVITLPLAKPLKQ